MRRILARVCGWSRKPKKNKVIVVDLDEHTRWSLTQLFASHHEIELEFRFWLATRPGKYETKPGVIVIKTKPFELPSQMFGQVRDLKIAYGNQKVVVVATNGMYISNADAMVHKLKAKALYDAILSVLRSFPERSAAAWFDQHKLVGEENGTHKGSGH